MRTIARLYDHYADAKLVVNELEASGIGHENISLVANADAHGRTSVSDDTHPVADSDTASGGGRGAVVGGLLGGGAGLLAGLGALAIPGVGPVVAAGWLIATLTGAAVGAGGGGLIGALTGAGVSHDEAHVYTEGVKRGASLVTIRVDDADIGRVEAIMDQRAPVNWQERRASYGSDWKGVDDSTTTYPAADTATEQRRHPDPAAGRVTG